MIARWIAAFKMCTDPGPHYFNGGTARRCYGDVKLRSPWPSMIYRTFTGATTVI